MFFCSHDIYYLYIYIYVGIYVYYVFFGMINIYRYILHRDHYNTIVSRERERERWNRYISTFNCVYVGTKCFLVASSIRVALEPTSVNHDGWIVYTCQ